MVILFVDSKQTVGGGIEGATTVSFQRTLIGSGGGGDSTADA